MPSAIVCNGLTRDFGSVRALDGLTLSVPENAIFAFSRCGDRGPGGGPISEVAVDLVGFPGAFRSAAAVAAALVRGGAALVVYRSLRSAQSDSGG